MMKINHSSVFSKGLLKTEGVYQSESVQCSSKEWVMVSKGRAYAETLK